jgi:hypothetical protein
MTLRLLMTRHADFGNPFVDELTDRLEARTVERVGLCETAEVIE